MSAPYYYPRSRPLFASALRPTPAEIETYAQLIAQREGCAVEACREQAELQLRAARPTRPRKLRREAAAT